MGLGDLEELLGLSREEVVEKHRDLAHRQRNLAEENTK